MALTDNERAINEINKDNDGAKNYINSFLNRTNTELYNRALKLNSAMDQFVQFLALPKGAKPPSGLDIALNLILAAVPQLAELKYIEETAKAAGVAVAIAKASGTSAKLAKAAKVGTAVVQKGGQFIEKRKVKDSIEVGKQIDENLNDEEPPANPLSQFSDSAAGVMNTLIESSTSVEKTWEYAIDALHAEYSKRLDNAGDNAQPRQSMTDWIKGILRTLPKIYSPDELKQLERVYLWCLIAGYVKAGNVYFQRTAEFNYSARAFQETTTFVGLNDTQQEAIVDLFGPEAPRGMIFYYPVVLNINLFLGWCGVKTKYVNKTGLGS
jgi:hypothetical protein